MPSSPILQAWAKTVGPSPFKCSLKRRPRPALARTDLSVALRTSSGSRRKSSPLARSGRRHRGIRSHHAADTGYGRNSACRPRRSTRPRRRGYTSASAGGRAPDDQREAVGQVVAGAAVEPHALAILARDDAETIVLDLVHPGI